MGIMEDSIRRHALRLGGDEDFADECAKTGFMTITELLFEIEFDMGFRMGGDSSKELWSFVLERFIMEGRPKLHARFFGRLAKRSEVEAVEATTAALARILSSGMAPYGEVGRSMALEGLLSVPNVMESALGGGAAARLVVAETSASMGSMGMLELVDDWLSTRAASGESSAVEDLDKMREAFIRTAFGGFILRRMSKTGFSAKSGRLWVDEVMRFMSEKLGAEEAFEIARKALPHWSGCYAEASDYAIRTGIADDSWSENALIGALETGDDELIGVLGKRVLERGCFSEESLSRKLSKTLSDDGSAVRKMAVVCETGLPVSTKALSKCLEADLETDEDRVDFRRLIKAVPLEKAEALLMEAISTFDPSRAKRFMEETEAVIGFSAYGEKFGRKLAKSLSWWNARMPEGSESDRSAKWFVKRSSQEDLSSILSLSQGDGDWRTARLQGASLSRLMEESASCRNDSGVQKRKAKV